MKLMSVKVNEKIRIEMTNDRVIEGAYLCSDQDRIVLDVHGIVTCCERRYVTSMTKGEI